MPDNVTATLETDALIAALNTLGDAAQPFINEAAHTTAAAVIKEADTRLRRQLGPNATGLTARGIEQHDANDGNGVFVVDEPLPHPGRQPFPNLPLWIERGTKRHKRGSHTQPARPFFYVSANLEEGAHERRIADAVQAAIDAKGLGR